MDQASSCVEMSNIPQSNIQHHSQKMHSSISWKTQGQKKILPSYKPS